jgi:hypothetical protein
VLNEATKGKCRQAQNQENKKKIWLKAQITKNKSKDTQWQSKSTNSSACLKTIKQNLSF